MCVLLGVLGGRTSTEHCPSVYTMCGQGLKVDPVQWEHQNFDETETISHLSAMASVRAAEMRLCFQEEPPTVALGASAAKFVANAKRRGDPQRNRGEGKAAVRIFSPAEPQKADKQKEACSACAPLIRPSQKSC